jgi:4,5-DOPA dioxygenase extradiol
MDKTSDQYNRTPLMPLLFVGHGSPMNAIEDNQFTRGWQEITGTIPKPMLYYAYQLTGRPGELL